MLGSYPLQCLLQALQLRSIHSARLHAIVVCCTPQEAPIRGKSNESSTALALSTAAIKVDTSSS